MAATQTYPVRVDASLDSPLSRWLWLVKWVLVIPHYIVLAFLWAAFIVLSAAAMVAIVFTGRYPRSIFEFNVGVLRWTWRVQYYAIGAFGTDRYPPFTLAEDPSYPAHLEVEYPAQLSRGLALVKWWLLAIPHYIIVGVFTGSGVWFLWWLDRYENGWSSLGLIGILAVIAAVVLLVRGRYPEQIYDFVLGMNRWVLRVAGYAGLMTDEYPPFRLDMGGPDPGTLTLPPATGSAPEGLPQGGHPLRTYPGPGGWSGGRIVSVVIGAVLVLCSFGLLSGSGLALWAQTNRHDGYADFGTASYSVPGYAIASDTIELHLATGVATDLIGTVRIQVTQVNGTAPAFVGIAPADAAAGYLNGMEYSTIRGVIDNHGTYTNHSGSAPAVPPGQADIWTARTSGTGTQTLTWKVSSGDWMVVAMNDDGSRPVNMRVNVAATLPALPWIATGLLIGGIVFLIGGILLIVIPVRRVSIR